MAETTLIQDAWDHHSRLTRQEEGPKPTAAGTLMRVSDTGSCLRQRGFAAAGIPECEEIDAATLLAFQLGTSIHESLQAAVARMWPAAQIETPIDLSHTGVSLSGHTDGMWEIPAHSANSVILEAKTVGGWAAKNVWLNGPKRADVAQAALYASGTDSAAVLMVYVAKEKAWASKALPSGINPGDMREWLLPLHEPDDMFDGLSPHDLALQELGWFAEAEQSVTEGFLPRAQAPNDEGVLEFVEYPGPYGVQSKGGYWGCRYCRHNRTCAEVGPAAVELEVAVNMRESFNDQ
jgi:hypothetical protein